MAAISISTLGRPFVSPTPSRLHQTEALAHSAQAPLRLATFLSPANLARPLVLSCFAGREWCGEINEMIWPILRDRRSRLVYGAYSSSPRAKGILRYSQMKEHGLAGCWGVG